MTTPPTPDSLFSHMVAAVEADEDMPAVVYLGGTERVTIAPCVQLGPHDTLCAFMGLILQGQLDYPIWVAVLMDTYYYTGKINGGHPGELAPLFAADDPRVVEALSVMCLAPDGPSYSVILPYVRNPDRTVTWKEKKEDDPAKLNGQLAEAMRALVGIDEPSGT